MTQWRPGGTAADYRGAVSQNSEHQTPEHEHVETRSELLPEEQVAGSDDPAAQAAAILADSDERTDDPDGTRDDSVQTPGTTTED